MKILATVTLLCLTIQQPEKTEELQWYTLEEVQQLMENEPKKVFVDVVADWCKWCKVMDAQTFTDERVRAYMNEHFHMVKLNAEQQSSISFKNKEYRHVPNGKRGVHELAVELLNGQMSYPSYVVLNAKLDRTGTFKGYKDPSNFIAAVKAASVPS